MEIIPTGLAIVMWGIKEKQTYFFFRSPPQDKRIKVSALMRPLGKGQNIEKEKQPNFFGIPQRRKHKKEIQLNFFFRCPQQYKRKNVRAYVLQPREGQDTKKKYSEISLISKIAPHQIELFLDLPRLVS